MKGTRSELYFCRRSCIVVTVKRLVRFTLCLLFLGITLSPARAAFSSLYVFGEIVSSTTNALHSGWSTTNYYQLRNSNGRVWVEVLAERQGIPFDITNDNWSYFGNYSWTVVTNVANFPTPPDAATSLFVVWVSSADLFSWVIFQNYGTNMALWTNSINAVQTNYFNTIQTLYNKGARTLIMPNAVDVTAAPDFGSLTGPVKIFTRQRVIDMNAQFLVTVSQATAQMPGLTIFVPDIFTLLDQAQTNAASFGLTNAIIDALDDPKLKNKSMTGPGASYVFWDQLNPTARFHVAIADAVEQVIAPTTLTGMAVFNGSNRLDVANIPIGRNGQVCTSSNLVDWASLQSFDSTNSVQSIFVPNGGSQQFYRLTFPLTWTWP